MPQKITTPHTHNFPITSSGIYSISITATCTKKNSLRIELDGLAFKSLSPKTKNEYFYIPPTWNGKELKGTSKTIIFIAKLSKGNHNFALIPKGEAELILEPKITLLDPSTGSITLLEDLQSEARNCQPWVTVALVNLPLNTLDISISCQKKFLDSDDVKLIIDGTIQKNTKSIWRGKNWFWRGQQLRGRTEINNFYPNLPTGIHYVELWADGTPILKSFDISLEITKPTKRVPTVNNPEWTGDFLDDPEEMILARLIFGEANNQSNEVKEWVGWSVINRTKANSWWPDNIHGVILQKGQYDPFKKTDPTFLKIINPLHYENIGASDKKSWYECYEIAKSIVFGKTSNPTKATHFNSFDKQEDVEWYEENIVPKGKFIKKFGDVYFYWSPN